MSPNFKTIKGSVKSSHQSVAIGDELVGEVWREQVNVLVSKLTAPRRIEIRWRWFAKRKGVAGTIGRGRRAASGFGNKHAAVAAALASVQP